MPKLSVAEYYERADAVYMTARVNEYADEYDILSIGI